MHSMKDLDDFFSREIENKIRKNGENSDISVEKYISELLNIPISDYVNDIVEKREEIKLESADIVQFSRLKNATDNFCKVLKDNNNPGLYYLEAGRLLQNDGRKRNDSADIKYGENHCKMAEMLGLAYRVGKRFYLSTLGYKYLELSEEDKHRFLVRLIIRLPLFNNLIHAAGNGEIVYVREKLAMLTDSTYIRRRSSIITLLKCIVSSDEYDFSSIVDNLRFSF